MYLYCIYTRGKCISYVQEASVDFMYERQVYIICMRGKCGSYVQEASVSPLDLEEQCPRKKRKRREYNTLQQQSKKQRV